MKRQSTAKRAFTLIELITVIGLIVIITMVALPAFQDIGRGAKMQTAVFNLKNTLGLARQTAVTRRRNIDLIFPDSYKSEPGNTRFEEGQAVYIQQSYAVFDRGATNYLSQWYFLPEGVIMPRNKYLKKDDSRIDILGKTENFFDVGKEGYGIYDPADVDYAWTPFPAATNDLFDFPAIVFDPRGRANLVEDTYAKSDGEYNPTHLKRWLEGIKIYMAEGFLIYNDDVSAVENHVFKDEETVPILWSFGLNPFTGKAFAEDLSAYPDNN
jgi:prepilin-type N-terminal cleavage/methylation domain-containing protein